MMFTVEITCLLLLRLTQHTSWINVLLLAG